MRSIFKAIAAFLSGIALFIASTATGLCFFFFIFDEPKMPESLILKQE